MFAPRHLLAAVALLAAAAGQAAAADRPAADKKKPPACAAISFRPLNEGMPDGEHMAGMYSSRFGRMELMGTVKGGKPVDYALLVKGKPIEPLKGPVPKSVEPCLKAKNVKVPYQSAGDTCVGPRFRVVIDNSGERKLLMLFALSGDEWRLCRAGTVPGA